MKKEYQKPILLKEEFRTEEWIATCLVENHNASLVESCSYTPPNVGIPIFTNSWATCAMTEDELESEIGMDIFCLHAGLNNVFGS